MGLKGFSTVLQYKKWGSRGSPQFYNIKMGLKGVSTVLQYKKWGSRGSQQIYNIKNGTQGGLNKINKINK